MIFSEVYSVYYNAVSKLIEKSIEGNLSYKTSVDIISAEAFSESFLYIMENIQQENWSLIDKDFKTPIKTVPEIPLTTLQKRFLKTISLDKRFKLFCSDVDMSYLDGVKPLYFQDDIYYFDQINDGDPYEDESYIVNFKKIVKALSDKIKLKIVYKGKKGSREERVLVPVKLEFSQKDDKFRLVAFGENTFSTLNLASVESVELLDSFDETEIQPLVRNTKTVTVEIMDYRNTLERCMLHFSHFEKEAKKIDELRYEMKLSYYVEEENEVLIRILSFGPTLRVTAPNSFISLIKTRLISQKSCE